MNTPQSPQPDLDPTATPRLRQWHTRGRVAGALLGASALAAATLGAGAIAGAQDTGSPGPADAEVPPSQSIEEIDAGDRADIDPGDFAEFEAFDRCVADESGFDFEIPAEGDLHGVEAVQVTDGDLEEVLAQGVAMSIDDFDLSSADAVELTDAELEELLAEGVAVSIEIDADDLDLSSVEAIEITDDAELAEMLADLEAASEECAALLPEGAGVAMLGADGTVVEFGEVTATDAAPRG
ncbi:MAG: hypothetical protein ACE367_03435 [Acidimicrobiales bacterium]